jgi:hypothetical protein
MKSIASSAAPSRLIRPPSVDAFVSEAGSTRRLKEKASKARACVERLEREREARGDAVTRRLQR